MKADVQLFLQHFDQNNVLYSSTSEWVSFDFPFCFYLILKVFSYKLNNNIVINNKNPSQ